MNILVLSDNKVILQRFHALVARRDPLRPMAWTFACSPASAVLAEDPDLAFPIRTLNVRQEASWILATMDLVFSVHCKQLFPEELVRAVRCINIHPGFNPYNRGWYPQVFSILNGLPAGATIHVMDADLDHGPIIAQSAVALEPWDTSETAYGRILAAELDLLDQHLEAILVGTCRTEQPRSEGNLNSKEDFRKLCELDLTETLTLGQAIDRLRALTHGDYPNAYFRVPGTRRKCYVKITLDPGPE